MKAILITTLFLYLSVIGISQDLKNALLTKEDSLHEVFQKYEYEETGSYGVIRLILNKNKTYLYSINTFAYNGVSQGEWKMTNNIITLKSTIQKNDIPIKISYGNNGDFIDSSNIPVVKNINDEPVTDAFVFINNDSIKCLPLMGSCTNSFNKINKVKVVFENGLSSKWICVKEGEKEILLTVLTDMPMGNYIVMANRVYKIEGNFLKQQLDQ